MVRFPILRAPCAPENEPPGFNHQPHEAQGIWRIVRGKHELGRYNSEDIARSRWRTLRELVVGHGAKLVRPDGTVAAD